MIAVNELLLRQKCLIAARRAEVAVESAGDLDRQQKIAADFFKKRECFITSRK